MRKIIMVVLLVLILGFLNYSIYEKEQVIQSGEDIFLELAPVDPRSIMQGDYMRLSYALDGRVSSAGLEDSMENAKNGYMVVVADSNNVAQYVRLHQGEELSDNEKLLYFNKYRNSVSVVPDSFLFQEGHAKYYEEAKYGIFKFDKAGKYLLVGLADKNRNRIVPPEELNPESDDSN